MFKSIRSKKPPYCTAVVAAAGNSARCKGEDKLLYEVDGKPVLAYTIGALQSSKLINEIVIVTSAEKLERIRLMCVELDFEKVTLVIEGGQTRLESVINGVYAASKKSRLIAIHDGARPCVDISTLDKTIHKAALFNAAAPAVAITSTIKKVEDEIIEGTVNREGLFEIQTPQIFRSEIIKAALSNAKRKSMKITDDCMAVEKIGIRVHIVEGSRKNIKITTHEDLKLAELYLSEENDKRCE